MGLQPDVAARSRSTARTLAGRTARQILDAGVGYVPEDRSVRRPGRRLHRRREPRARPLRPAAVRAARLALQLGRDRANAARADRGVRRPHPVDRRSRSAPLSGGNQQKVVVARELSRPLKLLVAAQPTRGVDVGSIEFIHKRIVAERDARRGGRCVVSTELDEVLALADRIARDVPRPDRRHRAADTPREELGLMMAGDRPAEADGDGMSDADDQPGRRHAAPSREQEPRAAADRAGDRRPAGADSPRDGCRHWRAPTRARSPRAAGSCLGAIAARCVAGSV